MMAHRRETGLLPRLAAGACLLLLTLFSAQAARAERAGAFDYYVLSLSWSPSYCARAGRNAAPTQCRAAKPFGFIVHGLWPQYERGYPDFCDGTGPREPSYQTTGEILDIMPSRNLVRHQWRKHGSCSGLSPDAYFDLTREAFAKIRIPAAFRTIESGSRMDAGAVETAFRLANPGLDDGAMAVACQHGRLSEVRICLTRDLAFRSCRTVDRRGCRQKQIHVPAPR
ncbi:ribonuclease T2 [Stappia sp. ES.058]|uniref:ribonuclease T2 family protein n=1 Tax=Stappia sp. ES.058 TaxID=1881061 RepID=UPI00087AB38E|nr:ribonuclease T2 [Stappia sp. ES.058]SDU28778.1 ribonuclease T2 [Stappia sp. ES.058]